MLATSLFVSFYFQVTKAQVVGCAGAESGHDIDVGHACLFQLQNTETLISPATKSEFLGFGYEDILGTFVMGKCSQEVSTWPELRVELCSRAQ